MSTTATTSASPAPALRARPGRLVPARVFIGRGLLHTIRNGEALLMAILLPTLLMLVFTYVFGGAMDPSGNYVDYVVPGIILTCAGFGASYTAVAVNVDMTTGIIDRFRTMPIPGTAVLVGHIVASVIKNLVATSIVIGVGLAIGFRPTASPLEWLAAFGMIALWITAITSIFAAIGLAAGSPDGASGYGFILLFLPYLSSGFVPIATMPEWLQPVARHQPITPLIESIRGFLMGAPDTGSTWVALAWCAAIIVVAMVWGGWLYRRKAGRR
ncbi:MAG TPA: ABC transporter permease [Protaetiibacter sp.]|nr:ABC transporter permease [Protaetiibacter sp.]